MPSPPSSTSLPLFDETPDEATHRLAFDRWLSDRRATGAPILPASVRAYRDMWSAFTAWCLAQTPMVTLASLDLRDMQAFQAARFGRRNTDLSLSPRHALRLVRLIDQVLRHHADRIGVAVNTAAADWLASRPEIRFADAPNAETLPDFISTADARRLIAFLASARPRPGLSPARRDSHTAFTWQELRDRAAAGLQLGGGLTPGDVRALTLTSAFMRGAPSRGDPLRRPRWIIAVPGNGTSAARETPLAPWAGELLHYWLQVRAEAGIQGDLLFPSTRTGRPWSKESQYACALRVMADAGVESGEGGSFQLRHTFALRQLRRGVEPALVARWLGVELDVMARYRRVVTAPVDVV
jgi:integrase